MKPLILLLALLWFSDSFGQKAPKGVKSIYITVDTTAGRKETFNSIASYLLAQNYEIDLLNQELGLIQTKDATLKFVHWKHRISAELKGNQIRFSGKAIVSDVAKDIENKGSLGSLQVVAFRKLEEVSYGYPHISVEYR